MAREIGAALFFVLCAVVATVAVLGMLRSRNAYAALHCSGTVSVLFPPLLLIGVLIVQGFSDSSIKTAVYAAIALVTGPIASHALAVAQKARSPR